MVCYSQGKAKYKLQMDEHEPDKRKYGNGVYWEIFIIDKKYIIWHELN